jgi:UDP-glucose 4-epimerase
MSASQSASGSTGRVVLVTGVSAVLGGRLARRLSDDPGVSRVIGVDVVPPRGDLGSVRFVRADIRNPVIAKVITQEDVDTVVHTSVASNPEQLGGRMSMKEHNIIGTMQLLAACQRAPGLERLVVKSSAEVYGSSNRDPAMFTEDMGPRRVPRTGYGKDVLEIEGYVRGFARRRPEVSVTVLRNASLLSPTTSTALSDYLTLNPIPKVMGFDARIQLLHYDDLVGALHHATLAGVAGTFNVAGEGVLPMSQAIRRLERLVLPVPAFALNGFGSAVRRARLGMGSFSPDQLNYLTYGRGLDTSRMRNVLGFEASRTTEDTLAEFARAHPPALLRTHPVVTVEKTVAGLLGGTHA